MIDYKIVQTHPQSAPPPHPLRREAFRLESVRSNLGIVLKLPKGDLKTFSLSNDSAITSTSYEHPRWYATSLSSSHSFDRTITTYTACDAAEAYQASWPTNRALPRDAFVRPSMLFQFAVDYRLTLE